MAKVGLIIDSEFGLTKSEAEKLGFFFIPITIELNGKEMRSNIEVTLEYLIDNLKKDTKFKTAAPSTITIEEVFRDALKNNEHALYIPLSKHLSSTYNYAKTISENKEFKNRITVYNSEFIGPWIYFYKKRLINMNKADASLKEYIEILSKQKKYMKAWLFPKNLDRLYASGRITKSQYMAGSLIKIIPIIQVNNGSLNNEEVIKARTKSKAIDIIIKNTINIFKDALNNGENPKIIICCLGHLDDNEYISEMKEKFSKEGHKNIAINWLPPAILGHVGLGGIGAGIVIDVEEEYKK